MLVWNRGHISFSLFVNLPWLLRKCAWIPLSGTSIALLISFFFPVFIISVACGGYSLSADMQLFDGRTFKKCAHHIRFDQRSTISNFFFFCLLLLVLDRFNQGGPYCSTLESIPRVNSEAKKKMNVREKYEKKKVLSHCVSCNRSGTVFSLLTKSAWNVYAKFLLRYLRYEKKYKKNYAWRLARLYL